jgi:hypothetical protein
MRTTQITDLYQSKGPFASVTLDVSRAAENAHREHELRVRHATAELIDAGADATVVTLLAERVGEQVNESAPVGRSVVANAGGIVFDELLRTEVEQVRATWGALPDVIPWIVHQDGLTPFVLATVDHEGGDVATYVSDVPDPAEQTEAGGETRHINKVPSGGWSQLRYQHVTENVWKQNAEDVADEILAAVRTGPDLVLLAGNPYSRSAVAGRLEGAPLTVVQLESGSRAEDGGDEALQQTVREALLEQTVARRLEMIHTLQERIGQDAAVAVDVDAVADAFVRGQVETLLLDPDAAAEQTVTPRDHPGLSLGEVAPTEPVPAHQAFVAAAVLTGAEVSVGRAATLGGHPVAALLRWDQ